MKKKRPVYELTIDAFTGVDAIALVEFPAIEEDFQYFSQRTNITLSSINTERRTITGPALIPDKQIFRFDEATNQEYEVYFTQDTVRAITEKFMIEKKLDAVNIEHNPNQFVKGVSLIEAWIVENPENDKANELGYSVNKGTLMTSYKIDNDDVLEQIKTGKVRGFSIEGAFIQGFSTYMTPSNDKFTSTEDKQIEYLLNLLEKVE